METGVYEILNTETGTWYRGATEKETFKERWERHKCKLNAGKHYNKDLQQDWGEYGADAFVFSVLERCPPEQSYEREKWWIGEDYKRSDISYNKKGGGASGFSYSEASKRNMSEAHKRPETIRKKRVARGMPFTCTWPDGRVKSYLSVHEAAPELDVGSSTIQRYLKGTKTPGGNKRTAHLTGCTFTYTNTP